jgi:uncharacterized protein (DUF58 family)
MTRARLLILLVYALLLAGLVTLSGGWLVLAVPLVVYAAAGLLQAPETLRLVVTRRLDSERSVRGEPVAVRLSISNQGPSLEGVLVEDLVPQRLTLVGGQARVLAALPAGETLELSYTLTGERGQYRFPGVKVTAGDPFDLFGRQAVFEVPGSLVVIPDVLKLKRVNIRPRRTRVYTGLIPARQSGPGVEFAGLRDYQPGDPMRWINARASARHEERLFVSEFEQERAADINLVLDVRSRSNMVSAGSLLDYAAHAAATLADVFISTGNRVGLFLYGSHFDWIPPGYGKVQRERLLQALARAKEGDHAYFEDLDHLPGQLFLPRSQMVVISPLLSQDAKALIRFRARGYPLLVFSPDPIAFEAQRLDTPQAALAARIARLERELLLRGLRQAGAHVVDWPLDVPFEQLAHRALGVRFLR